MFELNVVTAIPVGSVAAVIWLALLLRRLMRTSRFIAMTSGQRLAVCLGAAMAFLPALGFGFVAAVFLSNVTISPGPWNHLSMALTVVFAIAILGSVIPWAVARFIGSMVKVGKRSN
jgi:hypothetical protein